MRRGQGSSVDMFKALLPDEKAADPSVEASVDSGRIHPLLPTVEQAWDNRDQVYSDHLPRGGEWKPLESEKPLQFRFWNIMGAGASGFDKDGEGDFLSHEGEARRNARFKRISDTIRVWKDDDNVDFIALQEVSEPKKILQELDLPQSNDDQHWGFKFDKRAKTLTLYRKSVLTLSENSTDFLYKDQPIQIHNTYMGQRNFPGERYEEVKGKIADNKPSIVLGDFNCRFAPAPKSPPSLFTVVTSKFFRYSKKQGGDHVDAALVRYKKDQDEKKKEQGISQLETWVINPVTGEKYKAVTRVSSVDHDLDAERKRYSPVMEEGWMTSTLDDVRKGVKADYNISVFMAFNNEKDPKIALQFKDPLLYALYKADLTSEDKIICYDCPQGTAPKNMHSKDNESCVFIDHPQLAQFQKKIASVYNQMNKIKKMFPKGTVFSITTSTPGQSEALSLNIALPGKAVISIPVDKDIVKNLSSRNKKSTSANTPPSHHP